MLSFGGKTGQMSKFNQRNHSDVYYGEFSIQNSNQGKDLNVQRLGSIEYDTLTFEVTNFTSYQPFFPKMDTSAPQIKNFKRGKTITRSIKKYEID